MMKDNYKHTTIINRLSITQQKILCALAYLVKYYHTHTSKNRLLAWIETDEQAYRIALNELSSKRWLVEELPHQGAVPILLVAPKRLLDVPEALEIVHCLEHQKIFAFSHQDVQKHIAFYIKISKQVCGVTPTFPFKNRACDFHRTRLV